MSKFVFSLIVPEIVRESNVQKENKNLFRSLLEYAFI